MGKRRTRRTRGAQRIQPVAAPSTEPVAEPPVEKSERWWKPIWREAMLIGGGFIGAVSFAGVFKVDEWLANWTARPVELFREVANGLFFWVPTFGFPLRESLALSIILAGILIRGLYVENTKFAHDWYKWGGSSRLLKIIKILVVADILLFFPFSISFIVDIFHNESYDTIIARWQTAAFPLLMTTAIVIMLSIIGFKAAPRSTSYLLGFLALFYGWGLFVDGGYHKQLPRVEAHGDR